MNRKNSAFKGYEIFTTALRMGWEAHFAIIWWILAAHIALTAFICYKAFSFQLYIHVLNYLKEGLIYFFHKWILKDYYFISEGIRLNGLAVLYATGKCFLMASPVWIVYVLLIMFFREKAREQLDREYIRGAKLLTEEELKEEIKKKKGRAGIPIGNINMPVSAEPKHAYVIGRPGVGKTTFYMDAIDYIRKRHGRGIIYDSKGDYLSYMYNPETDVIFNPLDKRFLSPFDGWRIFNDIQTVMGIESMASSLIPQSYHADPFWNDGARDVLVGILHYLHQTGQTSNADMWRAVSSPCIKINRWLKETKGGERGYRYIEDASSKQALSILAVMMQYCKAFEYMSGQGGSFSIDNWLANKNGGWIFITNHSEVKDTLKPVLSLFIDLIGKKLLSLPDDYHRRIFFFLDEFLTLQRMPTIVEMLTNSRSKGGCFFLGVQDNSQGSKVYSPDIQKTIFNTCSTKIIFTVNDPSAAKELSNSIGSTEFWEAEESFMMGPEDVRDGMSMARRKKEEKLILDSEILTLEELKCYVKLPNYHVTTTTLLSPNDSKNPIISFLKKKGIIKPKKKVAENFIIRDDLILENIIREQAEITATAEMAVKKITKEEKRMSEKEEETRAINTVEVNSDISCKEL